MGPSVQEALKIGLVNNQIHTLVISGGTGVGKSYILRQCLEAWHIPYRLIPIYVENSQLQETIDFEASLEQGKMIMSAGLLDDTSTRYWVVDDGHVLAPEVRHALLVEAKRRQILLIMTINHGDRTLDDAEWELVDVHVSMAAPTLESRVAILQQNREGILCGDVSIAGDNQSDLDDALCEEETSSIDVISAEDMLSLIATKQVQNIAVSDAMLSLAISYALQARTVGHGAEYVLLQVMKSLAVLDGSSYCKPIHADRAALYVLPHRMKRDEVSESQSLQGDNGSSENNQNQLQKSTETTEDSDVENSSNSNARDSNDDICSTGDGASNQDVFGNANQEETSGTNDANPKEADSSDSRSTDADVSNGLSSVSLPDTVARIANQMFHWKIQSYKTVDRQYRKGSGRRLMTKTKDTRGRMIRAYQDEHALEDLALVDTLRAAAPYQRLRAAVKVEQEIQSTQSLPLEQQKAKGLSIGI